MNNETHISAEQDQAQKDPRIPRQDEHQGRSPGDRPPSRQRPQKAFGLGFSRSNRLLRRSEFQSCFETGRRYFTKHFVVFALPRDEREPWRLGLTVTRKTGSAPLRNRVKRVLREFFRLHQSECDPPHDYVLVPKKILDPRQVGLDMVTDQLLPVLGRIRRETLTEKAKRASPAGNIRGGHTQPALDHGS